MTTTPDGERAAAHPDRTAVPSAGVVATLLAPEVESGGDPPLRQQVRTGLRWSVLNNLSVRLSNMLVGVLLARLLLPEDFGVFAVALTVQAVLLAATDLGLSTDLIRRGDANGRGPTLATIAAVTSCCLAVTMVVSAETIAALLGDVDAAPAVRVMAITLVLAGVSIVPFASVSRRFMQKQLFAAEAGSFVVYTAVTIPLVVLADQGVLAMAWGRVAGQLVSTVLLFWFARQRPRFGFDLAVARDSLRFSAPLAVANLIAWALLNVDYVVISHTSGAVLLGYYVLAFNLSSWPMTAVGQAIRNVALPAFSRQSHDDPALKDSLRRSFALAWAAGVPISVMLAVLAVPLITAVYGERWQTSAQALLGLAVLGGFRVVFDVFAAFLLTKGASRSMLVIQLVWIAALIPAIYLGTRWGGIAGAGLAHAAVAALVVLPCYLVAMKRHGVVLVGFAVAAGPALAAAAPAGALAWAAARFVPGSWWALLVGGAVGTGLYVALMWQWVRGLISQFAVPAPSEAAGSGTTPGDLPLTRHGEDDTQPRGPAVDASRNPSISGTIPLVKVPAAVPILVGGARPVRIPDELLRHRAVPPARPDDQPPHPSDHDHRGIRSRGRHAARPRTRHDHRPDPGGAAPSSTSAVLPAPPAGDPVAVALERTARS